MTETAMEPRMETAKAAEKKPMKKARRRYARDLSAIAHREIPDQFELRGPDSDIDLAEVFETQRPSVMSILIHHLFQRVRKIEARQAMQPGRVLSMDSRAKGAAA